MTLGITPWSRNDLRAPALLPDAPGPAAPAPAPLAAPELPPDPACWGDFRSGEPAAPTTDATASAQGVDATQRAGNAEVQKRLDAFLLSMTAAYQTSDAAGGAPVGSRFGSQLSASVDGSGDTRVAVPFGMSLRYKNQLPDATGRRDLVAQAAKRARLTGAVVNRIQAGRGAPEEIRALTQALIDTMGRPPAGPIGGTYGPKWTAQSVRKMMFDCGVVIDCAGYAQQAYLVATGQTRQQAHFGAVVNEALFGLDGRGFFRVGALQDVRPGDILSLARPDTESFGHRAIVYDQRVATAADMRSLLALGNGAAFAVGGPVRVLALDSSWGSGGYSDVGGVRRKLLWYNESVDKWAWLEERPNGGPPELEISPTLYAHPLNGFYRASGH